MASSVEEKDSGIVSGVSDFLQGAFGTEPQQTSQSQESAPKEAGFMDSVKSVGSTIMQNVADVGVGIGEAISNTSLGDVGENALTFGSDVVESAGNAMQKIAKGEFETLFSPVSEGSLSGVDAIDTKKNNRDKYSKEFAQLNGNKEAGALLGGLFKTGYETLLRQNIGAKLKSGVDSDAFAKGVSSLETDVQNAQKQMNDILTSDPALSDAVAFENSSMTEYQAATGKSDFSSEEYGAFVSAKFSGLDIASQQAIVAQQMRMQAVSKEYGSKIAEAKAKRDKYVSDNVNPEGALDAVAVYEKAQEEARNNFGNSEAMKISSKIREEAEERLSKDLMERDPKKFSVISQQLPNLRDSIIEDVVRNEEFIARTMSNDRISESVKSRALKKFEDGSDVEYKFNIEFLNQYSRIKNLPEFKSMDDLEKHQEARKLAYSSLSPSERKSWGDKERIVNALNAKSAQGALDWENENVATNALQVVKLFSAGIGDLVDQAYDDKDDEIPHYVRQESRDITYANASGLNKFASAIAYNSDAVVGMIGAASAMNKVIGKTGQALGFAADLAKGSNVAMGITKIGALEAPLTFLGKGATIMQKVSKPVLESVLVSAATDPIADANQVQANTKDIDQMNFFIGTMFDVGPLAMGKGYRSMNEIVSKYALGESGPAVSALQKVYKTKFGIEKNAEEVKNELDSAVKIMYDTYDPKTMSDLFNKPGQIYDFLKSNVESLSKNEGEHQLNAGGLLVGLNTFVGLSKDDFADITKLEAIAKKPVPAKPTDNQARSAVLAKQEFDKQLSQIQEFAKGNAQFGEVSVDGFKKKDPSFLNDSAAIVKKVEEIRIGTTKVADVVPMIEDFKGKYGDKDTSAYVTLRQIGDDSGKEFRFKFQDLKTLDGMKDKSFIDVLREGKVKVHEYSQGLKAGDYKIVTTNKSALSSAKAVLKNNAKKIEKYVSESVARTGIPQSEIEFSMETGIRKLIAEGTAQFAHVRKITNDHELYEKEIKKLSEIVTEITKGHYGSENFGGTHYINDMGITGSATGRADQEELINAFFEQDGFVNVNFGKLKTKHDKHGEESNWFYVTLGKEAMKYRPNIRAKLSSKVQVKGKDDYFSVSYYANSASHILNNAVRYARKANGSFNFRAGLNDADLLESDMKIDGLFHGKEIRREKIAELVKGVIASPSEKLVDFITDTFKGSDPGHGAIISVQAMHMAKMYAEHEPIIKALFEKYGAEKKFTYVQAFADMILAPKLYEGIASNIVRKGDVSAFDVKFRDTAERQWKSYVNKIKGQQMKFQDESKKYAQYAEAEQDKALRDAYRQLSAENAKKAKSLESSIGADRLRESFIKNNSNVMMTKAMVSNIRNATRGFAFTKMNGFADGAAASIEEGLKAAKEIRGLVTKVTDAELDSLRKDYAAIRKLYDEKKSGELLDKMVNDSKKYEGTPKEIYERIRKVVNSGIGDINLADKEFLLKTVSDASTGVYDSEFIEKNNPFTTFMHGMVNGTGTRDQTFENAFMNFFEIPEGTKNLFAAYHEEPRSKKFVDFVDGLMAGQDGAKDYRSAFAELKAAMSEGIGSMQVRVRDSITGNVENKSAEYFEKAIDHPQFIDTLKRIADSEKTNSRIMYGGTEVWEYDKNNFEFVMSDKYVEKVLQIDILRKNLGNRIGFMRELAAKDFGRVSSSLEGYAFEDQAARITKLRVDSKGNPKLDEYGKKVFVKKTGRELEDAYAKIDGLARPSYGHDLQIGNGGTYVNGIPLKPSSKKVTLSGIVNSFYSDTYSFDPSFANRAKAIASPTLAYEFFQDLFNLVPFEKVKGKYGNKTIRIDDHYFDLEKNWGNLQNAVRLTFGNHDMNMRFMGSFGDKDGTYMFWKPSERMMKTLPAGYEPTLSFFDEAYRYEYALANGYHNGRFEGTFDENMLEVEAVMKEEFANRPDLAALTGEQKSNAEREILMKVSSRLESDRTVIDGAENKKTGIASVQDTKKRESANVSNYSTFEGFDKDVECYILKEDNPSALGQFSKKASEAGDMLKDMKKAEAKGNSEAAAELKSAAFEKMRDTVKDMLNHTSDFPWISKSVERECRKFGVSIDPISGVKGNFEQVESVFDFLNTSYFNDYEDGTSYVSSYLAKVRAKIQGAKKPDSKMEFKDHFFGGDAKGRVLGKTLFNSADIIDENGEAKDMAVVLGVSSFKLGKRNLGTFTKFSEPTFITINGERREVVGKVSGARTSYFKNAATESRFKESDVSASDSIMAKLKRPYAEAIMNIQKFRIDQIFAAHKDSLSDPTIKISTFSKTQQEIMKVVSATGLGLGHNSVLNAKLNALLSAFNEVITKPRDGGQSMYIYKSTHALSPEEVMVSKDSQLYQIALSQRNKRVDEIRMDESLSQEAKDAKIESIEKHLLAVGYRYPVPSRHALGFYKIVTPEDEDVIKRIPNAAELYAKIGTHKVVLNPESTYMKLQGDNDGDHLFFLPVYGNESSGDIGNVLANSVIADSLEEYGKTAKIDPYDKSWEWFAKHGDEFANRFVTASQVEKASSSAFISLREARNVALTAKSSIGIVAAYGRTMTTLKQMVDSYASLSGKEKEAYGETLIATGSRREYETMKISEFAEKYGEAFARLDGPNGVEFDANFASLLQLTLDFGNSGNTTFDMDWYLKSLGLVFGKDQESLQIGMEFFHDVVTKLSTTYNEFNIDINNVSKLARVEKSIKEGKFKFDPDTPDHEAYAALLGATGNKRELVEYMLKNHGEYVAAVNNNLVLQYAVRVWNLETKDKFVAKLKDVLGNASSFRKNKEKDIADLERSMKSMKSEKEKEYTKKKIGYKKQDIEKSHSDVDEHGSLSNSVKWSVRNDVEDAIKNFADKGNKTAQKVKEYMNAFAVIKTSSKSKFEEFDKLAKKLLDENETEDVRNAVCMVAATYDIREIYQALMNAERIEYLRHADEGAFKKLRDIGMSDAIPDVTEKSLSSIEEKMKMIEAAIKDLDVDEDDIAKKALANLESEKKKLENLEYEKKKRKASIEKNILREIPEMDFESIKNLPDFGYESVLKNPHAFAGSIETAKSVSKMQDGFFKLTTKRLFEAYLPEFTGLQEYVRNFFKNDAMVNAYRFHVDECSPRITGRSDSIYRQIKQEVGRGSATDAIRYVQQSIIKDVGGNVSVRSDEELVDMLKRHPEKYGIKDLVDRKEFIERVLEYRKQVVEPILGMVNEIGRQKNVDIYKAYRNTSRGDANTSLLYDALEAYKSDNMFAAMILGMSDESKIKQKISEAAAAQGAEVSDFTKRMMSRMIVSRDPHTLDKVIDFMQGLHYTMNYGLPGMVFGGALVAGLAQMLPNYVELRSYMNMNRKKYEDAYMVMKRYKILDSEDTLHFSVGHGLNIQENFVTQMTSLVTKSAVETVATKLPISKKAAIRAGEIVDSALNNMLGFNDWPLEQMRKVYAIANEMESMGIKDAADFERRIQNSGTRGIEAFSSRVSRTFSESGGGAVSSWNVSRGTVFSEAHLAFDNLAVRFVLRSLGYLNGWAYHKAATLIEKNGAVLSVPHMLQEGRYKDAAATFKDAMRHDAMMARQFVAVTGLYMKVQRYENDENDKMGFIDFQKAFNNGLVWTSILFDRYLESWAISGENGGTLGDKVGFTANAFGKHVFRHLNQANFFMDAWRKYNKDVVVNGSGDLAEAFSFAFENNYNSFLRFGGLQESNRLYSQSDSDPMLGILFVGADTPSDKIVGNLQSGKSFARWEQMGMGDKLLSIFPFMSGYDDSMGYNLSIQVAKELEAVAMNDPKLRALVYGGRLGNGKNEYDLSTILGSGSVSARDAENIDALWKKISYYKYETLNAKGERVSSNLSKVNESKEGQLLEKRISEELARNGVDIASVIKGNPEMKPGLLKTLQVLNMDSNLKTPLVLSVMMDMEFDAKTKELRDTNGQMTGQKGPKGPYRELSPEQQLELKRSIMTKYQEYMNLDNSIVMEVVSRHFRTYNNDVLEKLDREYGQDKAAYDDPEKQDRMLGYQAEKLLTTQYLVSNIMKTEGDTSSVTRLQSQYALAMRGLDVTSEVGVNVAVKFLRDLELNRAMDEKTRLAHQAAVIYGLNKTQYGILKDEKRFAELSKEAQTKIANWTYKVSSGSLAYDANSYLNGLNKSSEASGYSSYKPKFGSKKFSGERPNFAKQFDPVRQFMPTMSNSVSHDPGAYVEEEMRRARPIGYGATPQIQKEYAKIWFEQVYFGQKSKGVIPTYVTGKQVDEGRKSYIKVGTSKKKLQTDRKLGKKMSFQSKFGMLNPGKAGTQSFIMDPGAQQQQFEK